MQATRDRRQSGRNLVGLAFLNTIVERGLLESEGLDQVEFANRSLHEFLCASSWPATPRRLIVVASGIGSI